MKGHPAGRRPRIRAGQQKGAGIAASPRVTGLRRSDPEGSNRLVSAACATRAGKGMRALRRSPGPWPPLPRELPPPVHGGPLRECPKAPTKPCWIQVPVDPWLPAIACALASACGLGLRLRGASARSFRSAFAVLPLGASGPACAFPSAGLLWPPLARRLPHPDLHRGIPVPVSWGHPRASSFFRTV